MKTNFDGIKKTAEKNFQEEIYTETSLSETIWAIVITLVGLGLFGYMVGYHIIYKLIIQ